MGLGLGLDLDRGPPVSDLCFIRMLYVCIFSVLLDPCGKNQPGLTFFLFDLGQL